MPARSRVYSMVLLSPPREIMPVSWRSSEIWPSFGTRRENNAGKQNGNSFYLFSPPETLPLHRKQKHTSLWGTKLLPGTSCWIFLAVLEADTQKSRNYCLTTLTVVSPPTCMVLARLRISLLVRGNNALARPPACVSKKQKTPSFDGTLRT